MAVVDYLVFKDLLFKQLSNIVGLSTANLQQHIPDVSRPSQEQAQLIKNKILPKHQISTTPTRFAIALLLQYPTLATACEIPEALYSSDLPGLDLLIQIHNTILQTGISSPSVLLERWRDTENALVINKLMQLNIPEANQKTQLASLKDAVNNLLQKHRDNVLEALLTLHFRYKLAIHHYLLYTYSTHSRSAAADPSVRLNAFILNGAHSRITLAL